MNGNPGGMPDFYVVGLQEVSAGVKAMLPGTENIWVQRIRVVLEFYDYYKVKDIQLQGMVLAVFAKNTHEIMMMQTTISTSYVKNGMKGTWGNKGAVMIQMVNSGTSICFVNSHLHAHEKENKQRISDYQNIINGIKPAILDNDVVVWIGDLNFRVSMFSEKEVYERIQKPKPNYNVS